MAGATLAGRVADVLLRESVFGDDVVVRVVVAEGERLELDDLDADDDEKLDREEPPPPRPACAAAEKRKSAANRMLIVFIVKAP